MLCIINCQNVVIKIHYKALEGISTAKILNIQINNLIRSDIKV